MCKLVLKLVSRTLTIQAKLTIHITSFDWTFSHKTDPKIILLKPPV